MSPTIFSPTARKGRPNLPAAEHQRRWSAIVATLSSAAPNLKGAAMDLGLKVETLAKYARGFGWRTMWVTGEERRHLLERRRHQARASRPSSASLAA